jgi:hypothetical protein
MDNNDSLLWQVRHFVYNHFADTTLPPGLDETTRRFNITVEEASELYKELHNRHAFFLEPETLTIRMANPFSAIPTNFKVQANGKTYYANCAWDMLGIPAALNTDAVIEAVCTESNELVRIEIINGQINASQNDYVTLSDSEGSLPPKRETLTCTAPNAVRRKCRSQQPLHQSDMLLIHFPLPFARWYDNLTFT